MDYLDKEILKEVALDEIPHRTPHNGPSDPVDHWSQPILLERAAYLKKMARFGDGSADETLRDYPQHRATLSFRSRDSDAAIDENFAELYFVLAGTATLVTGGTVTRAQTVEHGETRGDSIEGGARRELKAGDIAHVPAGLPHQIVIAGEKTVTCFVLKINEAE